MRVLCTGMRVLVYMCVHVCVRVYMYVYVCTCMCIMCVHVCVYVYMYVYVCTCMYVHVYPVYLSYVWWAGHIWVVSEGRGAALRQLSPTFLLHLTNSLIPS